MTAPLVRYLRITISTQDGRMLYTLGLVVHSDAEIIAVTQAALLQAAPIIAASAAFTIHEGRHVERIAMNIEVTGA